MPADLRPYQFEAVAAIVSGRREAGRGQLHAACGTGKTRMAAEAAARLVPAGVIVVLVPSITLAAQTLAAWPAGCPVDAAFTVCSDPTAGTGASGLGVPASTDPEVIAKRLANAAGRVLVVATYDSAHRLDEAMDLAGRTAELVVCDEAHRTAGRADKVAAAVLRDGFLPGPRLYMTATPQVITGTQAGGGLTVASMDDESIYGPVLYRYPFAAGIRDGYLSDYRLVVAASTDAQVRELAGDRQLAEDGVPVAMAAAQAALAMAAAEYGLRRCVVFTQRVEQARLFAQTLPRILDRLPPGRRPPGAVSAGVVHGDMTTVQRDLALDRLRNPPDGGWAVVTNARCLSEGIDIPAIDSVMFTSPKESVIDIAQAVGRALRPHGDTDTATVVVPALLPDSGEQPLAGPWRHILNVVRALAAHDETLTASLRRARARRAASGAAPAAGELPARIVVQAPPGTVSRAIETLRLRIIDGIASRWWDGYGHARAYHSAHGNLDIPFSHVTASGFRLGGWLTIQRSARNQGKLSGEQIRVLDELGIIWDQAEATWLRAYADLRAFADEHGHFEIPGDCRTSDGAGLAAWAHHQRADNRKGIMPAARRELLEQAGFPWDAHEARWMRRYRQAAEAITRHGGVANLPPDSPEAAWAASQYDNSFRLGRLTGRQIALLEQAGIRLRPRDPWRDGIEALKDLKEKNGNLRIPQGHRTSGGLKLSNWATRQRARWNNGELTSEQIRQLEELGFTQDPAADQWSTRYAEARAWKEEHGHLTLPARHPLRDWIYTQRRRYDAGKLSADHARLLHDIGAISCPGEPAVQLSTPADQRRDAMISALKKFTAESGHARVPRTHVTEEGLRLGDWLTRIRGRIAKNQAVDPAIVAALRECGLLETGTPGAASAGPGTGGASSALGSGEEEAGDGIARTRPLQEDASRPRGPGALSPA